MPPGSRACASVASSALRPRSMRAASGGRGTRRADPRPRGPARARGTPTRRRRAALEHGSRSPAPPALPDRRPARRRPCCIHLRRDPAKGRAARRRALGASGSVDVPAPGVDQRERSHGLGPRPAGSRGHRRGRDRDHDAPGRRLARALQSAQPSMPAGPAMQVDGAQCLGETTAQLALFASAGDSDGTWARDGEAGLLGVIGGDAPLLATEMPLLALSRAPSWSPPSSRPSAATESSCGC